ncbi:type IV pilin [Methanocella sp. CWC-04]|uniref:Type IV pilin n=2 Tax=Methanooceanicella nereidis TaxID=2052831 RepID=A0AAP2W712_9EURY|nr:type IV pilin [Methanocella sp. CWC-04]
MLLDDDRGVENAVYGILMIAVVVIVALMIGSIVLSQGGQIQLLTSSPKASLSGVLSGGSQPTLLINHESGDTLQTDQLSLSVFDSSGVLIGTTSLSSLSPPASPSTLSPGLQTSAIPLNVTGGNVVKGAQYTIKVTSIQTKQQIGMMLLVAR